MPTKPAAPLGDDWAKRERRAKRWGKANGYKGRSGGWIYDAQGRPVCQGWGALWSKFRGRIDA